jgi:hypothetical protein
LGWQPCFAATTSLKNNIAASSLNDNDRYKSDHCINHGSTAVFSPLTFSVKRKTVYIADEEEEPSKRLRQSAVTETEDLNLDTANYIYY